MKHHSLKKIISYYFSSRRSDSLILFNVVCLTVFTATSVLCGYSLMYSGIGPIALLSLVSMLLSTVLFFVANVSKRYKLASIILVVFVSFIVMPGCYFLAGSTQSGMASWFILAVVLNCLVLDSLPSVIIMVLQLLFFGLCFYFSYKYRYQFDGDFNIVKADVFSGIIVSFFTVSVLTGLSIRFQNRIHRRMFKKLARQQVQLRNSEKRASEASRAKSDFLSNMSHEIRTPINAILGMNEMILRENHDKAIFEYASAVQTSGKALLGLINDILDISKIESGRMELINGEYNLADLINDSFGMVSGLLDKKGLYGRITCDEELPSVLFGDCAHVRQVLVNLLSNAVKYTEKGGIDFTVSGSVNDSRVSLIFSVKDTGIGIKQENIGKLFAKFERIDMLRNRTIEGTGLGLAISRHIAELMGGSISVKSVYGKGSEFTLSVEQRIINKQPVGPLETSKALSRKHVFVYHQSFEAPEARVLAVDDVELNLIVFENLLKETKMKIDVADSGARALELASQTKYDMIFMDHMMPEMDGIETLSRLNQMGSFNKETPVVMLTANALSGVREEYISVGFCDYISKPLDGQCLEKMFLKYLPEEKIIRPNIELDKETPLNEKIETLKKLLPDFDYDSALGYCDDSEEFVAEILSNYYATSGFEELQKFWNSENWPEYQHMLHGLKSITRTVGFTKLADEFTEQEALVRSGDYAAARSRHSSIMAKCQECLEKIKAAGLGD